MKWEDLDKSINPFQLQNLVKLDEFHKIGLSASVFDPATEIIENLLLKIDIWEAGWANYPQPPCKI